MLINSFENYVFCAIHKTLSNKTIRTRSVCWPNLKKDAEYGESFLSQELLISTLHPDPPMVGFFVDLLQLLSVLLENYTSLSTPIPLSLRHMSYRAISSHVSEAHELWAWKPCFKRAWSLFSSLCRHSSLLFPVPKLFSVFSHMREGTFGSFLHPCSRTNHLGWTWSTLSSPPDRFSKRLPLYALVSIAQTMSNTRSLSLTSSWVLQKKFFLQPGSYGRDAPLAYSAAASDVCVSVCLFKDGCVLRDSQTACVVGLDLLKLRVIRTQKET